MNRTAVASILWKRLDTPGHDACRLDGNDAGWMLHGTAVFRHDGVPARLTYQVICDPEWRTLRGQVEGWLGVLPVTFSIARTDAGVWTLNGLVVSSLENCVDLDLGFTPATNLLPLRRLDLIEGQSAEAPAAWLNISAGTLAALPQRYERLSPLNPIAARRLIVLHIGFLWTILHSIALAFGSSLWTSTTRSALNPPAGDFHPSIHAHAGRTLKVPGNVGADAPQRLNPSVRGVHQYGFACMNKYFVTCFVAILFANFTGCSKRAIFEKAIAYERDRSNLSVKAQDLSFGKVVYLTNNKNDKEETIVMLHGFGADKDTWVRFARNLSDDYRLIIPDLPGDGESTQDVSLNYGIQNQATRLHEFLSSVSAKKVHVVGSSMGGAVALRFTFIYHDAVKSLTLIDSYGAIRIPSALDEVIKATGKNPMLEIASADDYKAMMHYAMVDPPYIPGFLIDVLAEAKIKRKAIEQKILKDIAVDADQMAILGKIHAPTLILWGKQDSVLHVDNAGLLEEKIRGSRKVLIEQTGHVPMVENPEETARHFREFLKEVAANVP